MGPTTIKRRYGARIRRLMKRIADECAAANLVPMALVESSDDQYEWWLTVRKPGRDATGTPEDDDVDVRFEIVESESHDGTEKGINFEIRIASVGGTVIGGLTPHNYTPECWVRRTDHDALERRFKIVEGADAGEVVALITDHMGV